MRRALLVLAVAALYVLHQDIWFWRTARPLVFGFVPIGLFYHAWPGHLEEEAERQAQRRPSD